MITAAMVVVAAAAVACSGVPSPPPEPQLELVSTAATTTEGSDTTTKQEFRLEVTLSNVGQVPASLGMPEIVNAGFYKGPLRVGLPMFTVANDADLTPLAKAETRVLPFVALERNDHRCPLDQTCDQNPHTDLLDVSATLTTDAGSWFFRLPIAFTCPTEPSRVCAVDVTVSPAAWPPRRGRR